MALKCKLMSEKEAFLKDLRPKYILPSLLKYKTITPEENKRIIKEAEPSHQVEKLFSILVEKSSSDLKYFVKALEEDEDGCSTYPWLAKKLETTVHLNDKVLDILANGNVPYPINHFLPRENKLNTIRNYLTKASQNGRHWVVLFGPISTGKSVLAAEAVRDNTLIKESFPGGVYWLPIGDIKGDEAMKLKVKKVLKLIDCKYEFHSNDSTSDLTHLLRKEIRKRPKMLLMLIDVWNADILNALDVACPVLVTTTNKDALKKFSDFCSFEEFRYDLSAQEISYLLSLYVNCETFQLPEVVNDICKKCKGSPLYASLIGSIMANVGNNEKCWKDLNNRLESRGTNTLRRRINSGNHEDLAKILHLCLEPIIHLKDYYLDFLIFYQDIPVPNKVLEILWGKSVSEVMDIMFKLYNRCFVQMEPSEEDDSSFSYTSHDLYLGTLRDESNESEIKDRHKKLVNKLLQLSESEDGSCDLSKLPKSYIPFTIGYHLKEAGEYKMLEKLYLDLLFVEQKIHLTDDVMDILMDYQIYRECFENEKHVETFESFLNRNAKALAQKTSDIIQLALCESRDSIVYQKAKDYASKMKNGKYFDWCNKEENIHCLFDCSIKYTDENIKYAVFNHAATLVACVGETSKEEAFGRVWSTTGDVFQELIGHTAAINYCSFNSKGDYLATASNDETVKIFKIGESLSSSGNYTKKRLSVPNLNENKKSDNSFLTFTEHQFEVVCCSYSPDDNYVMSSDITGITYVWEIGTGRNEQPWAIKHKICHTHLKHYLSHSCFSNKGKTFGTVVYDTIKLWDFKSGKEKCKMSHTDYEIKKLLFTSDDLKIISIYGNMISLWTVDGKNEKSEIDICSNKSYVICSCCLSPNGKYIACGTSSGSVVIINLNSKVVVNHLRGHEYDVINVMFSKDGKKLLSVSSMRYIIHDMTFIKDTPLISFEGNLSVRMDQDITIASSNYFNCIEVRKGFSGHLVAKSEPEKKDISSCSLSNDSTEVVYGTKIGTVKVLTIATQSSLELEPKHDGQVNYILHSKNNFTFFTCSADKTIRVWKKGSGPISLRGHRKSVRMCTEFKKSDRLLSCSKDGSLRVWDTVSGECMLITEGHGDQDITFCDISPKEDFLASASVDGNIKVWNAANGEVLRTFCPEENDINRSVRCCRFSSEHSNATLISGLDNGKVALCHLLGNLGVSVLPDCHDSVVHCININLDGSQFLSISKSIKLWGRKCEPLHTILLPSSFMGAEPPSIWTSDNFDVIVVILNSILYILRRIK